jgi:protein ImuB
MSKRFVAIWFRHLTTDRMIRYQPALKDIPFVVAAPNHGRMIVTAANFIAQNNGVQIGMAVADCRAILPELQVFDENPGLINKVLKGLAEWCIRFTPIAAVDAPDGLILDASGCTHLWGGEDAYLKDIFTRLKNIGYEVKVAMADTIGAAWAVCRYGKKMQIVEPGNQITALLTLPPTALRLETAIVERLEKLGLYSVQSFIKMPRSALRRRFGEPLLTRIDQAIGQAIEVAEPVIPIEPYHLRLPSLDPIRTVVGIEIALEKLLELLCKRLTEEEKGLRKCVFKCYRVDNNIQQIEISTNRPSRNVKHLFKLFEIKIVQIEPALGIELFILEAPVVEDMPAAQEAIWNINTNNNEMQIAELLDRITGRLGMNVIHRYLPDEHYLPERSIKIASALDEQALTNWRTDLPRPIHLLKQPEPIEVSVAIPDYPPILFHYKSKLHTVQKSDGPERIEQEWWLQDGLYRDYYCIEDEQGSRFWIFRSGNYKSLDPKWFIHGFFA